MTDITLRNVDADMLNAQRLFLINMIWDDDDNPLWGLVNILDAWYDDTHPLWRTNA